MDGVYANVLLKVSGLLLGDADLGIARKDLDEIRKQSAFRPGTALVGAANILFPGRITLDPNASMNLDLSGTLLDSFNDVVAAEEVMLIWLKADKANGGDVIIGGAASNRFAGPLGAGTYRVKPGERFFALSDNGWRVTPGTGDILKVQNGGAQTASFDIIIFGRAQAGSSAAFGQFDFTLPTQSGLLALLLEDF